MSNDHVGPFELMFNIQLGKTILSFLGLIFLNEIDYFFKMVAETGPVLVVLGLSGAMGQVFIFLTIAQFGALMCSLIGLARKIVTLLVSILFYHHPVNSQQGLGTLSRVDRAMIARVMDVCVFFLGFCGRSLGLVFLLYFALFGLLPWR